MTEKVFASIGEYGMNLSALTGASGSLGNLRAVGTQMGPTGAPHRVLEYNYENQLVHQGTNHSNRRGLNVAVFNTQMQLTYMATFDLYGDKNSIPSLISRLKALTGTEIAVMTTHDAIGSTAELDQYFKEIRSVSWPTVTHAYRCSYVAILCGKKKHIVAEKFVGNGAPSPNAEIEMSFSNPNTIGYSGYGELMISDDEITSSTGVNDRVKVWLDKKPLTDLQLKPGNDILITGLGEIDDIAHSTNTYIEYDVSYYDKNKSFIESKTKSIKSVEGWEQIEIRDTIPADCAFITVEAISTQSAGRAPSGTVYVKNVTMQATDNLYATTSSISFGLYGTSTKRYEDSLGNFGHYDPDGYHRAYNGSDNLLKNMNIGQHVKEPVRWFNRVLDTDKERLVMGSTSSIERTVGPVGLDPNKWYYVCVWTNKQVKETGTLGLSLKVQNSAGNDLELTATDLSNSATRMYSQKPDVDMLEERQWYLLQGFILPHKVDPDKASEFIEKNKEFYGWDDLYGNGIGVSDEGDGYYGWINNVNCVRGTLIFSDEDNNASGSKTLWALPILKELSIGSVDIDDGVLTSISLGS